MTLRELQKVKEGYIIGCNFVYRILPRIDMWAFLDGNKVPNEAINVDKMGGSVDDITKLNKWDVLSSYFPDKVKAKFGVFPEEGYGYSPSSIRFWTNTGYFAVNAALHLNFDKYVLVGFDCSNLSWVEGKLHTNNNCEDPLIERLNTDFASFSHKISVLRGNRLLKFKHLKLL
jgi:hypothetical protein